MFLACRHQAIPWIDVHLSPVRSSDIHLMIISQEIPQQLITTFSFKITVVKFNSNPQGTNELNMTEVLI